MDLTPLYNHHHTPSKNWKLISDLRDDLTSSSYSLNATRKIRSVQVIRTLVFLKPIEKYWQPSDFLLDASQGPDGFIEEVRALRQRVLGLSDEYFVILLANMLGEETLPTNLTVFNTWDGVRDETGSSSCPWVIWSRAWAAEENRHGDLLRTYIYLSGRVDMMMIEKTMQYMLRVGLVTYLC
ncbi:hypothetical protein MTR67_000940 [Solanum verrucosum]|uniref:Acyl-[acyl-carrier-protein] desaturase n=1 Tax=Solanum verrucosum TaxID=315347 RepID=A0AAF0TBX6_SOLVR|nr:hypothetical protein MTR67_000940 [Solanum verrucosum]